MRKIVGIILVIILVGIIGLGLLVVLPLIGLTNDLSNSVQSFFSSEDNGEYENQEVIEFDADASGNFTDTGNGQGGTQGSSNNNDTSPNSNQSQNSNNDTSSALQQFLSGAASGQGQQQNQNNGQNQSGSNGGNNNAGQNATNMLVTQQSLDAYVRAQKMIAVIEQDYQSQSSIALPQNVGKIQEEKRNEMMQAIQNEGLTYEQYQYIGRKIQADPLIMQEYRQELD